MPRHLSRLVRTLHLENTTFFVHIDRKADIEVFRSALRSDNLRFVNNRVRVNSADFSCVQATINLIKVGYSTPPDYMCLLSGSDYPLRSAEYIQQFFSIHKGAEFISTGQFPVSPSTR